eukprot:UN04745
MIIPHQNLQQKEVDDKLKQDVLKRVTETPAELVMVSRLVTTYTYNNALPADKNKFDLSQTHPHLPIANPNTPCQTNQQQIQRLLDHQAPKREDRPLLTIHANQNNGAKFASLVGNTHPRMLNGIVPRILNGSPDIGQLDVSFALYLTTTLYQALIQDDLTRNGASYSLFHDRLNQQQEQQDDGNNTTPSITTEIDEIGQTIKQM